MCRRKVRYSLTCCAVWRRRSLYTAAMEGVMVACIPQPWRKSCGGSDGSLYTAAIEWVLWVVAVACIPQPWRESCGVSEGSLYTAALEWVLCVAAVAGIPQPWSEWKAITNAPHKPTGIMNSRASRAHHLHTSWAFEPHHLTSLMSSPLTHLNSSPAWWVHLSLTSIAHQPDEFTSHSPH